jgi:uncharacterized protein (TIGR03083 family)
MLAVDLHDRAIAAADRAGRQFCTQLAGADRPDAIAVGAWRVRDVGAHLTGVSAYTDMVRGVPSPARSIDEIAAWNAENVAAAANLDCVTLAERVGDAYRDFLAEARLRSGDELVGWHGGLQLPSSTLSAVLAGEAYIHGWDVARALQRPWPLDPDDMRTIFLGLLPVLPHYVVRDDADARSASFDVRLRGDPDARATFGFDGGTLRVSPSEPERVDCRISADPAAFLLVTYGRTGLLKPVLSGRILASGRKPWLGLSMPRRFRRP